MNATIRRLGATLLVALAITACSGTPAATVAPTDPPTVAIRTAPAGNLACMDALMSGTLARHAGTGLGVTAADGQQMAVEWPFRYSAWVVDGRIVLLDETGKAVAREGDKIQAGGGFGNAMWHACGSVVLQAG